jgi:ribosomal protein S21
MITVKVRKGDINRALKTLKDCVYITKLNRELMEKREYEKPSDRRRRKHFKAVYGQRVRQAAIEKNLNR